MNPVRTKPPDASAVKQPVAEQRGWRATGELPVAVYKQGRLFRIDLPGFGTQGFDGRLLQIFREEYRNHPSEDPALVFLRVVGIAAEVWPGAASRMRPTAGYLAGLAYSRCDPQELDRSINSAKLLSRDVTVQAMADEGLVNRVQASYHAKQETPARHRQSEASKPAEGARRQYDPASLLGHRLLGVYRQRRSSVRPADRRQLALRLLVAEAVVTQSHRARDRALRAIAGRKMAEPTREARETFSRTARSLSSDPELLSAVSIALGGPPVVARPPARTSTGRAIRDTGDYWTGRTGTGQVGTRPEEWD